MERPGGWGNRLSLSLSRGALFVLEPSWFRVEPPGEIDLGRSTRIGVVGETSNLGLVGVSIVKGASLGVFLSSLAVLVRLEVGTSNSDAPFVDGSPEILGSE